MKQEVPNSFYRVSVKGLIFDENREKFLIIKEDNGWWELPGGGLDWEESVEDALRREIKEEMGLTVTYISKEPLHYLRGLNMKDNYSINLVYEIKIDNLQEFIPSRECLEIKFVTPKEAKEMHAWRNVKELAELLEK
ncbi:MAG: NUDIX hydrolase [Candidatus Paceibacterota bacterium]|jgi:ADP-ribose pyrophosphatase YjhB (NUDIX family)